MISQQEHYIHDLSLEAIISILENGAWEASAQSLSREISKDWQLIGENTAGINPFADIDFGKGVKRILDVCGGRYDYNRDYLKREKNIALLVWDPFNRSREHNNKIKQEIQHNKVDAATSMSVLNVIAEPAIRLAHIVTLKASLRNTGKAYFKIWPGAWPFRGSYYPVTTESAYQANAYADRFYREIELVFGDGHVKIHDSIPNLIVATKMSEAATSPDEVEDILRQSLQDTINSGKARRKPINKPLY